MAAVTDEQVMDDLIACPWEKLNDFGTQVRLCEACMAAICPVCPGNRS